MIEKVKVLIYLIRKRTDLFTKCLSALFIFSLFSNYLYDTYNVNIVDTQFILSQKIQIILQKIELIFYWLIPFVYFIPLGFLFLCAISLVMGKLLEYFEGKYDISFLDMPNWCNFLYIQSLYLFFIGGLVSFYIGGLYYILATFNHIGQLISTEVYMSSLNSLNPIKDVISFSSHLVNMTHKGWIEISLKINSFIAFGLCIFWCYISSYLTRKKALNSLRREVKYRINKNAY